MLIKLHPQTDDTWHLATINDLPVQDLTHLTLTRMAMEREQSAHYSPAIVLLVGSCSGTALSCAVVLDKVVPKRCKKQKAGDL